MKWITPEHPKIDRIACPWLIQRFIDKEPEFLYVPADQVLAIALWGERSGACLLPCVHTDIEEIDRLASALHLTRASAKDLT